MGQKPLSVVLMETIVLCIIGVGSIVGLQSRLLSSDAVTAVWGMMLGYAFKNGYQYVNRYGQVINGGGITPQPSESARTR